MPSFDYQASDQQGNIKHGLIEADSERLARQLLRDQQLIPLQLSTHKHQQQQLRQQSYRLRPKDLSLFFRHLATLLAAGIPLAEGLNTISAQTVKRPQKRLMTALKHHINEGLSLAQALRYYPRAFSSLYCAAIHAGEQTGRLDTILAFLADYSEKQHKINQQIKHALIYPSLMITVSILIVSFLLMYVVPKIVDVFSQTGQSLPGLTLVLLHFSSGLKHYGIYLLILLIAALFTTKRLLQIKRYRYGFDRVLLRLPVIAKFLRLTETSRFLRTLGILQKAGVDIITAMHNASDVVRLLPLKQRLQLAAKKVSEGTALHQALHGTKDFALMSLHLIHSGENAGHLDDMLLRAANNQDDDMQQVITTALSLFEPALILIMGGVVLFIVLAILLPIFSLDQIAALG